MDLQLFGNNDTVTSGRDLKLVYRFADNDTRTTSLPNPKADVTGEEIASTSSVLKSTQAFVGDKNSGAFDTIQSATIIEYTRRDLDLT